MDLIYILNNNRMNIVFPIFLFSIQDLQLFSIIMEHSMQNCELVLNLLHKSHFL